MRHVEPPPRRDGRPCATARALGALGRAFDVDNRTIDVRRIAPRVRACVARPDPAPLDIALHGPGRFNIPDVAIHLWRWQSWRSPRRPRSSSAAAGTCSARSATTCRCSRRARSAVPFTSLTTRADVPQPIDREELPDFYGPTGSILLIADGVPVDASQIYCANLADRPGGAWCTVAVRQDRDRPRARSYPVRRRRAAAAVAAARLLLRLPGADRRRPLRPVGRRSRSCCRPPPTTSRSSARPTTRHSRARSRPGTSLLRRGSAGSSCCQASSR